MRPLGGQTFFGRGCRFRAIRSLQRSGCQSTAIPTAKLGAGPLIMDNPTPAINPAEFGTYVNSLAARIGGVRATRGMSRAETIGRFAKTMTDENEDSGGGPWSSERSGTSRTSATVVCASSRRASGAPTSERRCARWPSSPRTRHGLQPKPLSAEARNTVD